MPLELIDNFKRPWLLRGPHRQTIAVNLFRSPSIVEPVRKRFESPDGDFFDVDQYQQGSRKCIIIAHGLEGDGRRQYVRGLIKPLYDEGWDGLAMNFRGCSGELNRLPRSYHCGDTGDIQQLLDSLISENRYDTIVLAGFSLGANVALLLAGKAGQSLPSQVKAVIGVSVPMDLVSSIARIERKRNWHYVYKFMQTLRSKAFRKIELGILDKSYLPKVKRAKNFTQFDHDYTAPLHGFESGLHYWKEVSSLPYLEQIRVPSLILNAQDDTFLSGACFPKALAQSNKLIHLSIPSHGGHVGFVQRLPWKTLWTELRIKSFLIDQLAL